MTTVPNVSNHSGLRKTKAKDYVILLDSLEFAFPKHQLDQIADEWNAGMDLELLSKKYKRVIDEMFLALFHLSRQGKIKRPLAKEIKHAT